MKKQHGKLSMMMIIIILVVVLILGGGGFAAYTLFLKEDPEVALEDEAPAPVEFEVIEPIVVKVGPLTVNILSQRGERLLYTSLMIKVKDETTHKFLYSKIHEINNRMLILLSEQYAEELKAPGGKEELSARIMEQLQIPFTESQPPIEISGILYQDFLVQ